MKLLSRIDLHLVYALAIAIPMALLVLPLLWSVLGMVLFSQPMIITRYYDQVRMELNPKEYLYANELLVFVTGIVMVLIGLAV